MTLKTSYLLWLLLALVAGIWPLIPLATHAHAPIHTASIEMSRNA